jgi:hypothetical protein
MNLNTVMLPVYWDLIEPEEGKFDFSLVRGAIDRARNHGLHLVYLWFGSWKNSMSCYAPGWVKRDTTRFERAKQSSGETMEIISPESTAANEADARAFASLMRWTKDYDAKEQTVIMAQVENEIGMIPEARDHSEISELAYKSDVPSILLSLAARGELGPEISALWEKAGRKTRGTWNDVFGPGPQGEEVFSAWQFANYVEKVAASGKKEYPLPMYANAALIRPGYLPGQYPSAGPLPHLLELWRAGAPSLDMICPDIYFPNFMEWCGRYVRNGNPLFIPEMAASARAPANALYAAAQFGAIGFGPFSIENVSPDREQQIANCYGLLAGLSDLILNCQQNKKIIGLSPQIAFDWTVDREPQRGELGGVAFEAQFDKPADRWRYADNSVANPRFRKMGSAPGNAAGGRDDSSIRQTNSRSPAWGRPSPSRRPTEKERSASNMCGKEATKKVELGSALAGSMAMKHTKADTFIWTMGLGRSSV